MQHVKRKTTNTFSNPAVEAKANRFRAEGVQKADTSEKHQLTSAEALAINATKAAATKADAAKAAAAKAAAAKAAAAKAATTKADAGKAAAAKAAATKADAAKAAAAQNKENSIHNATNVLAAAAAVTYAYIQKQRPTRYNRQPEYTSNSPECITFEGRVAKMPVENPSGAQRVAAERDFNQRGKKYDRDKLKAERDDARAVREAARAVRKAARTETDATKAEKAEAAIEEAMSNATFNEQKRSAVEADNEKRKQAVDSVLKHISAELDGYHEDYKRNTQTHVNLTLALGIAEARVQASLHTLQTAKLELEKSETRVAQASESMEEIEKWQAAEIEVAIAHVAAASAEKNAENIRIEYTKVQLQSVVLQKQIAEILKEKYQREGIESRTRRASERAKENADKEKMKVDAMNKTHNEIVALDPPTTQETEANLRFQGSPTASHNKQDASFMQSYNAAHAAAYSKCYKKIAA